jgi:mono/diheme cytochrome c family protein
MKKNIINLFSITGLLILFALNVQAQWKIDPDLKDAALKVDYSEANIDAGKAVFEKNCKACHLELSVADKNDRAPGAAPNLGNKEFQKGNSDGEIFCKISFGNGSTMPPYETMLSEDDRWKVIAYIRSFDDTYEPPAGAEGATAAAPEKFEGTVTGMELSYDKESNSITAKLEGTDAEGNKVNPKNVKVNVFIQRYFGLLPIAKDAKTDDKGMLTVEIGDVPADTSGFVSIIAATSDGKITAESKVQINEGWKWVNPLEGEHLWGTRAHTPWWLMLLYFGITGGVLLTIAWAVLQLFRIWILRER